MQNPKVKPLLLICALALSACSSAGQVVKQECPILPPVAASLMQDPTTEQRVRAELLQPQPLATPKSVDSKLK